MGGIQGMGIATLLRANKLDDLSILVRETVQNSWDARLSDSQTVGVSFLDWKMSPKQRRALRAMLGGELPDVEPLERLGETFARTDIRVLSVRDVNCHGLDGPTLGDEAVVTDRNRYVSFVLNVGASEHSDGDGGSFGYGRSITYRISRAMLILIYTRIQGANGYPESRFVASMLTDHFNANGAGYTGRHWWGQVDEAGRTCRPVVGDAADLLAESLGAEPYSVDERGTTIMIIDPVITNDAEEIMKFIADALVWNMWPKMIPDDQGRLPMRFEVVHDGIAVPIREPMETFPISHYCDLLEKLRSARAGEIPVDQPDQVGTVVRRIESLRPKVDIGLLALKKHPMPTVLEGWAAIKVPVSEAESGEYSACAFKGNPHHVAVMRTPELVVDYFEYAPSPDEKVCWLGVFRAHDHTDAHFKAAEPPTHDSWNKNSVPRGVGQTVVNRALIDIAKMAKEYSGLLAPKAPPAEAGVKGLAKSLAAAFDQIGHVRSNVRKSGGGGGRGPSGGTRAKLVDLVVGSPRMRTGTSSDRMTTVSISVGNRKLDSEVLSVMVRAGIVEGDDVDPAIDSSMVRVLSVESTQGKVIWASKEPTGSVTLRVALMEFPLSVSIESDRNIAVSMVAQGYRD
jgi:hypothetical protein